MRCLFYRVGCMVSGKRGGYGGGSGGVGGEECGRNSSKMKWRLGGGEYGG